MRRLEKSQGLRRIERKQRARSQVMKKVCHPKAADPADDREMQPAQVE
jgi:hypothetical protein